MLPACLISASVFLLVHHAVDVESLGCHSSFHLGLLCFGCKGLPPCNVCGFFEPIDIEDAELKDTTTHT